VLDFFLPPPYPISHNASNEAQVNYSYFWGKMAVAFPASLAYAFLLVGAGRFLRRRFKNDPDDDAVTQPESK
jgi:hypothetical protein